MKKDIDLILSHTQPNGECLEWTRCFNTDGYPRAAFDGYANGKVHRVVYELSSGENIDGMVVRHTCDNPKCINPEHLIKGTNHENMMDRNERSGNDQAKVTKDQVRAIRELAGKFTHKQIGAMFGISESNTSSIIRRTHWKHVT